MKIHPSISVSQRSTPAWSIEEDIDFFVREEIKTIGIDFEKVNADKLDELLTPIASSGIKIGNLRVNNPFNLSEPEQWSEQREVASKIMDVALELHPDLMVVSSGAPGTLPWERAADSFEEVMRPMLMEAEREGIHIAIEHTDSMLVDTGFIHTLHDAIDFSWRIDTGVCMVVDSCWSERNLAGTISAGIERISLVRIADRALGSRQAGTSIVPGDGNVPIGRILNQLIDAGYPGYFDLVIAGPEIESEGYESAIKRSLQHLSDILGEPESIDETDN